MVEINQMPLVQFFRKEISPREMSELLEELSRVYMRMYNRSAGKNDPNLPRRSREDCERTLYNIKGLINVLKKCERSI